MNLFFFSVLSVVVSHDITENYIQVPAAWPSYPNTPLATGTLKYTSGNTTLEGFYAYPNTTQRVTLPGLIVVHQYLGLGAMERFRAIEMAARGFIAFAIDMYGVKTNDSNVARSIMGAVRANTTDFRARLLAGWNTMKNITRLANFPSIQLNASQLFATGYCFGGGVVFELARMDLDGLLGVAGFHPSLSPLLNASSYPKTLRASVQAHHAQLDSSGDQGLLGFESEMKSRNASVWSTHKYGNCMHGWTDPSSSIYRPIEAEEAHSTMRQHFGYLLGRKPDISPWTVPVQETNVPVPTTHVPVLPNVPVMTTNVPGPAMNVPVNNAKAGGKKGKKGKRRL